jgi:hypothetical protein
MDLEHSMALYRCMHVFVLVVAENEGWSVKDDGRGRWSKLNPYLQDPAPSLSAIMQHST